MYKVFIENKPVHFHFNSELDSHSGHQSKAEIWGAIDQFIKDDTREEIAFELKDEVNFKTLFEDHKYIEAAGGIVQRGNSFLFIKRHGLWDIPKGKLEKEETPESGAVREIEEECGLVSPVIKEHLLDTWHTYPYKGKQVLKKTFWYWLNEGPKKKPLVPQGEEGITEVDYFPVQKFPEIKKDTYRSIIDVMICLKKKLK